MKTDETVKALRWLAKDTEFIFAAENLNDSADLIESLTAQLAESQRRADAAVEDMKIIVETASECNVCKHRVGVSGCPIRYKECKFEWRGPVAGKGETE